jgi:hypothetical protein
MFRSLLMCAGLVACAVGCQNTYKQDITEVKAASAPMTSKSRVYIAMPEDAMDKKEPVPSSGKRTALALQEAFTRQTKFVTVAKVPETLADAIEHARNVNADFVAFPTILEWKDRPTEWTGVRDRLQLQIDVIEVSTGETIRSTKIQGTSRWMTDGEDAPQDLLADPVDKFVRGLFRVIMTPSALQKK